MSLFDIANAGFAAQDAIKVQNRERQNFNANVAFQDKIAAEMAPIPRMLNNRGKIDQATLGNINVPASYQDHYNQMRQSLPKGVMPNTEMINEVSTASNDAFSRQLDAQFQQMRASGIDDKKITKSLAKNNPGLLNFAVTTGSLNPASNKNEVSLMGPLVATGGVAGLQYLSGLAKYVPQGKEIVQELGETGYKMRGYDAVGNRLRGQLGQPGSSLQQLTLDELTDKNGPYKFSKSKATQIINNRGKGSLSNKAITKLAQNKGTVGKAVANWLIKGARVGRLASTAAAPFSMGSSLLTLGLFYGGEQLLTKMINSMDKGE